MGSAYGDKRIQFVAHLNAAIKHNEAIHKVWQEGDYCLEMSRFITGVGVWRGSAGAELTDGVLVETLSMSDPDMWVEVNRVKDRHGGHVRVKWQPGHPEKRKARDGSGWDMHDRAVFTADEIAEDAHKVRQPRVASKLGKGNGGCSGGSSHCRGRST